MLTLKKSGESGNSDHIETAPAAEVAPSPVASPAQKQPTKPGAKVEFIIERRLKEGGTEHVPVDGIETGIPGLVLYKYNPKGNSLNLYHQASGLLVTHNTFRSRKQAFEILANAPRNVDWSLSKEVITGSQEAQEFYMWINNAIYQYGRNSRKAS